MPYLRDDEQKLQRPAGGRAPLTPTAPGTPSAAAPQGGSGDWVNIQQYINANQGASDNTANQLGSQVEKGAQDAKAGVDSAKDQFREDVRQGVWTPEKGTDTATPAYGGPSAMADHRGFADLTSKVNDAQARVQATGAGGGLQAHMQERNGGNYTTGQSALDAALVGNSGGRRFQQLRGQYGGLTGYLDAANQDSAAYAKQMADQSEQARTNYISGEADRAAAAQAEAERQAARQAELERQQQTREAQAGRGDLQNSTVSIDEEKAAMNDDLYYEWLRAGSPPYDEWKASRGG